MKFNDPLTLVTLLLALLLLLVFGRFAVTGELNADAMKALLAALGVLIPFLAARRKPKKDGDDDDDSEPPPLADLVGVAVWAWYLLAAFAASTTLAIYLWRVHPPRVSWRVVAVLIGLVLAAYVVAYLLDIPSIVAVLTNGNEDIPPASSWRTGFAASLWSAVWYGIPVIACRRSK